MSRWERKAGLPLAALLALVGCTAGAAPDLWQIANENRDLHRFSTLVTAQQVRDYLGTDAGVQDAIAWCKDTAVTKVYLETFRSTYLADRETLQRAKEAFEAADIEVSGCVTTTQVGKISTGWNLISCYTDNATQDQVQEIFEYTASLFDEIMIDDFWFTDCTCGACDAARTSRTATVGEQRYPVAGETWEDYRCELMLRVSQDRILKPVRAANPDSTVIIKYPQWYEQFHERGYEVMRQTAEFDRIWVGTETRDYDDPRWGGKAQYEAYFLMRWLGGIGGEKCGGGWFDALGTTQHTYVEQARQTILAGAQESMLFCYGLLLRPENEANVAALRAAIPELLTVAEEVARRQVVGVAAYRPPNSHAENESYVYDFVGMMGVPLVPCHEFPEEAPAAFFPVHALKDPAFPDKLKAMVASGRPVLMTDGLAARIDKAVLDAGNVQVLEIKGKPKSLLEWELPALDALRAALLDALGKSFQAPNKVALYLFTDGSWVVENFNPEPVTIVLDGRTVEIAARDWDYHWE